MKSRNDPVGQGDYYRILHDQPDAPLDVIRSSYRTLMQWMRAHPDPGGDNRQAVARAVAVQPSVDPGDRQWLVRAEFLTLDLERTVGAFVCETA